MSGRYELAAITGKQAVAWIAQTHRHLPKVEGALFASQVKLAGETVGVATAGNPARVWQGTGRVVISRVAVVPDLPGVVGSDGRQHAAPVCTMLYRSLCGASQALGYREAWTYTLPDEDARSVRAAGFLFMGYTKAEGWDRPSRSRAPAICADRKARWARGLTRAAHKMLALKALPTPPLPLIVAP